MPRFVFFLCLVAAVLALGEGRDEPLLSATDVGSLPVVDAAATTTTFRPDSERDVPASTVSDRIGVVATEKPPITVSPDEPVPVTREETAVGPTSASTRVSRRPALPSRNVTATTVRTPLTESSVTAAVAAAEDASLAPVRRTDVRAPLSSASSASFVSHGPGKWVVNVTNRVCVVVQMAVTVHVSYTDVDDKTSSRTFEIPADNTTRASGFCGESEQNLTLEWPATNLTATDANLTLHFVKNQTANDYSLRRLDVSLPAAAVNFPNSTLNETIVLVYDAPSSSDYVIGLTESYRCLKRQTLWLKRRIGRGLDDVVVNDRTSGYLTVSDLQFQAFKSDNSTVFGLARDCAFDTPDAVPIAVGCALAALVVIVLVAYLIGRRRNQFHGYLSM
ncbi:lysosome-associated membrane glycoprotein 1 [Ceratina calcarata]|uniref:Lysosome-associated membrane glycoprotein 5 n=1 Tax=Ceratina calcarata TaxID=156304 RepID=A0AAJ7J676_9HYME|nr:lysosome-associated membrane glycoprotein 1 [Ceratina calcarata]